jgi:hypothetical protein
MWCINVVMIDIINQAILAVLWKDILPIATRGLVNDNFEGFEGMRGLEVRIDVRV